MVNKVIHIKVIKSAKVRGYRPLFKMRDELADAVDLFGKEAIIKAFNDLKPK